MKPGLLLRMSNDTVLLWSACVFALCAGYYVAFGVIGAAIDRQDDRTGRVSAIVLADTEMLAQRPALEREERAIDDRLRKLQLRADKPTTVARFIHAAARIAAAQGVKLVQIDERGAAAGILPPASGAARPLAGPDAFEAIPLDVTLSGTYRALLTTIRELAQAPVTMQIEIAAIERNGTPTGTVASDPLSARLHVALQRLTDDTPLAATHALPEDRTIHARPL